jgi:hypothetical protein
MCKDIRTEIYENIKTNAANMQKEREEPYLILPFITIYK